ncbi:MAG: polysaccharide deacetylase family protein, partial [Coriobacteriales bacterium]|nr:polysaccharide deacetylase family protein [Coriobacteriales bacterium]
MTDTGDKRLFLTFDDGPSALYTPQLLDLLAFHDVKATFFVLGEASIQNPRIIERMLSEGHELGVHAYDHRKSVWRMSREEFGRDLDDTLAGIAAASGGEYPPPRFYRPPWGRTRAFSHDE